jgi:hypothetical protein
MGEQAQRHKKIEDNPHYQNRERDQRGEDHNAWRIAGGIGHFVVCRAWSISVRENSTTPAESIPYKVFTAKRGASDPYSCLGRRHRAMDGGGLEGEIMFGQNA